MVLLVGEGLVETPPLYGTQGRGQQVADRPVAGRQERNGSFELGKEASQMVCTY